MREDYFNPKTPHELVVSEYNSLRGKLCNVIESASLPLKQERALVTLIKQLSYQSQAVISELIDELGEQDKVFSYVEKKLEEHVH